tara:strand:- start:208 stop:363 length:156 start_codon:yes stop_codon:yes gene_type:complete
MRSAAKFFRIALTVGGLAITGAGIVIMCLANPIGIGGVFLGLFVAYGANYK